MESVENEVFLTSIEMDTIFKESLSGTEGTEPFNGRSGQEGIMERIELTSTTRSNGAPSNFG